jgi:murein DD-endopeptidase MepM/ murein hydrolase activator NlpD
VTCNGPARPDAHRPFLSPPYRGWTAISSVFDHDLPDFSQDGMVVTSTGLVTRPDTVHHRTDFPAYWSASIRQYVYYDGHNGYDYNISYQPVYAAASGKVIYAALEYWDAPSHGYGFMVMIDHRNGYVTLYGHFSKILVKKGQKVKRGQRIGISGDSGHSTGPHLHFTVFHNCTPTDPYGWSGFGTDPLANYQGETAENLWIRQPLIDNPLPHWPGLGDMPSGYGTRVLLLRLPTTRDGAKEFIRDLTTEARTVRRASRRLGAAAVIDSLRGAVQVTGRLSAEQLLALPDVVSISEPDMLGGERSEVLHALARASLDGRGPRLRIAHSPGWRVDVVRWENRVLLVGRGQRGRALDLRLPASSGRRSTHVLHADRQTGDYAIDLGSMSAAQQAALVRSLAPPRHPSRPYSVATTIHARPKPTPAARRVTMPALIGVALLILALAALTVRASVRRAAQDGDQSL